MQDQIVTVAPPAYPPVVVIDATTAALVNGNAARLAFEDMLVARERAKRVNACHPQRRTFGRGKVVPACVAHREQVQGAEAAFAKLGGVAALTPAQRRSAWRIARRRLAADIEAGRCLCGLPACGQVFKEVA